MDIDKFKEYNDTYGHLAGDICLQKVAKTIEKVSDKPGVYCARYGGDEFIMIYEDKSDEEIMSIAEELNKEIEGLDITHNAMGEGGRISLSQGICNSVPKEWDIQEEYLNEADNALYAIKKRLDLPGRSESVRLVHL
jgi:diguanylate cyclase (GGDEF)-like protein